MTTATSDVKVVVRADAKGRGSNLPKPVAEHVEHKL